MNEIWIGIQLIFDFNKSLKIDVMENKFEQMASTQQSEHQVKQFKSKQQLKKEVLMKWRQKQSIYLHCT